jgi:hypothetical protein
VVVAATSESNAADMELVWFVASLVLANPKMVYEFIIATKDKGFKSITSILARHGHAVKFVSNWEDLREVFE